MKLTEHCKLVFVHSNAIGDSCKFQKDRTCNLFACKVPELKVNPEFIVFCLPEPELAEGIFKNRLITAAVRIALKQEMETRYKCTIDLAGVLKGVFLKRRIDKEPEI